MDGILWREQEPQTWGIWVEKERKGFFVSGTLGKSAAQYSVVLTETPTSKERWVLSTDMHIYLELAGLWEIFPWSLVDSLHRHTVKSQEEWKENYLCPQLKANPSFFVLKFLTISLNNLSYVFLHFSKKTDHTFSYKYGSYQNDHLENDGSVPFSTAVPSNTKGWQRVPSPPKTGYWNEVRRATEQRRAIDIPHHGSWR